LSVINSFLEIADEEIIEDCLTALFHLTSKKSEHIKLLLNKVNINHIIVNATHKNSKIILRALSILGSICSETDKEVEIILNADGLAVIAYNLNNPQSKSEVQAKACWVASNIAYGPVEHIQQLIDSKIIEDLCYLINNTSEYKVLY
jgi:hypothetical protein